MFSPYSMNAIFNFSVIGAIHIDIPIIDIPAFCPY